MVENLNVAMIWDFATVIKSVFLSNTIIDFRKEKHIQQNNH